MHYNRTLIPENRTTPPESIKQRTSNTREILHWKRRGAWKTHQPRFEQSEEPTSENNNRAMEANDAQKQDQLSKLLVSKV